jgi:transcriptional regulator with XRE-family HTH domain
MSGPIYTADGARLRVLRSGVEIARLCAARPMTVADLARAMGLSQRSIWRYLAAMQAAGIDFEQEARWPAPAWRLDRRAWLGLLDLPTRRSA